MIFVVTVINNVNNICKNENYRSLLITRYSLLITHYSLLITHYSLLITHYSLLITLVRTASVSRMNCNFRMTSTF